ncbi:hypothetical protein K1J50_05450 [Caldovatus sp. SYSU G05006]|uniref:Uncharacterized protein n=1 Tax=Caldovatus aquaticus TaxID=2865671 RepID=A0ABS7F1S4_9PROT|nr:hypothetical protein [Caldovatus aquaticus]
MHEFKHGALRTARGRRKVRDRKQAIAIALCEAGASRATSPARNRRGLARPRRESASGPRPWDAAAPPRGRRGRSCMRRPRGAASPAARA